MSRKKNKTYRVLVERAAARFAAKLFSSDKDATRFVAELLSGACGRKALVWTGDRVGQDRLDIAPRLAWQPACVDRVAATQRIGELPGHQDGCCYALDFSSAFAMAPLCGLSLPLPVVLDMCAAPGGKAVIASQVLKPEVLICNEVIGKRLAALISNLERCRIGTARVTRADPEQFSHERAFLADVVIVDAPCSGQSLIARGERASGCFQPAAISVNVRRQRRILANAARVVRGGGFLLYSTCTFSHEENEGNVTWLTENFPHLLPMEISALQDFRSKRTELPCYRLWPWEGLGSGAFTCLFRSTSPEAESCGVLHDIHIVWPRQERHQRSDKSIRRLARGRRERRAGASLRGAETP